MCVCMWGEGEGGREMCERYVYVRVAACVCVRVCACVRVCVCGV